MKSVEHSITDDEFEQLSNEGTRGHSGCDIASLARDAAMRPVREFTATLQQLDTNGDSSMCTAQQVLALEDSVDSEPTLRAVTYEDFLQSLNDVTPSCGAMTTAEE
jgi:SpoVK/Ycf46/Vps4 family AAA+-type ATPase